MLRCFATATALCALLVASTALAQPGGGGRRGGGFFGGPGMSVTRLLAMPEVQKELGLSDDEIKQVQTASDALRQQAQSGNQPNFRNFRNMSDDERAKARADMRAQFEKNNKAAEDKMGTILTADQMTRLKQLELQAQGAEALTTSAIVDKLKITDEQKAKIQKVVDAGRPQGGRRGGGGGGNNGGASRSEQRAKTLKDALAVLDDDQLVQWGTMTGKEFKFPEMGFGGGRNGRNRGGNGGGGNGGGGNGNGGGNGGN